MSDIDTGDTVKHGPTGETWIVAYVEGERLAWVGWPQGEARLSDCTLIEKATPEYRDDLLCKLANIPLDRPSHYDRRRVIARSRLGLPE